MAEKRILYISQEIAPYLPSSSAAQLGHDLPHAMVEKGWEVRTFMPRYGTVNERRNQLHEVIRLSGINIPIQDTDHPLIIKVASMQPARIQVYFVDNDDYFQKSMEDIDPVGSNRADNDERIIFFARGSMETIKKLRWETAIMHCSGWITSLMPIYSRRQYSSDPAIKATKIVYTVTPDRVEAPIDARILDKMRADGIAAKDLKPFRAMEVNTNLLHKMALSYADAAVFLTDEPDPELMEIVEARKIPFILKEEAEKGADAYDSLYNSIIKK